MINKIFETILPILAEKCKTVEKQNELQEKYMSYLLKQYEGSLALIDNNDEIFTSKYIDSIIRDEREKWVGLSIDEVDNCLDEDEAYTNFLLLSFEIFEKAKRKKTSQIFDEELVDYEILKNKIIAAFNDIKEINRDEVSDTLSETLVELDYIYGLSGMESFRLSHESVNEFGEDIFGSFEKFDSDFKIDGE